MQLYSPQTPGRGRTRETALPEVIGSLLGSAQTPAERHGNIVRLEALPFVHGHALHPGEIVGRTVKVAAGAFGVQQLGEVRPLHVLSLVQLCHLAFGRQFGYHVKALYGPGEGDVENVYVVHYLHCAFLLPCAGEIRLERGSAQLDGVNAAQFAFQDAPADIFIREFYFVGKGEDYVRELQALGLVYGEHAHRVGVLRGADEAFFFLVPEAHKRAQVVSVAAHPVLQQVHKAADIQGVRPEGFGVEALQVPQQALAEVDKGMVGFGESDAYGPGDIAAHLVAGIFVIIQKRYQTAHARGTLEVQGIVGDDGDVGLYQRLRHPGSFAVLPHQDGNVAVARSPAADVLHGLQHGGYLVVGELYLNAAWLAFPGSGHLLHVGVHLLQPQLPGGELEEFVVELHHLPGAAPVLVRRLLFGIGKLLFDFGPKQLPVGIAPTVDALLYVAYDEVVAGSVGVAQQGQEVLPLHTRGVLELVQQVIGITAARLFVDEGGVGAVYNVAQHIVGLVQRQHVLLFQQPGVLLFELARQTEGIDAPAHYGRGCIGGGIRLLPCLDYPVAAEPQLLKAFLGPGLGGVESYRFRKLAELFALDSPAHLHQPFVQAEALVLENLLQCAGTQPLGELHLVFRKSVQNAAHGFLYERQLVQFHLPGAVLAELPCECPESLLEETVYGAHAKGSVVVEYAYQILTGLRPGAAHLGEVAENTGLHFCSCLVGEGHGHKVPVSEFVSGLQQIVYVSMGQLVSLAGARACLNYLHRPQIALNSHHSHFLTSAVRVHGTLTSDISVSMDPSLRPISSQ